MKYFSTIIILLIAIHVRAQKVMVLDRDTAFPVENVAIYTDSNGSVVYTDKKGIVDLSRFKDLDILFFNHLSYVEYEILKRELGLVEFVVYLTRSAEILDEIVLSASKDGEKRSRIAEHLAIISRAEIKRNAPQTTADLLANIEGVKVQKSQFGGGSPVIRGMEANRVLLVIDGVRMNNAIYRMGHLQNSITVSPNSLDRTEVIFGPSSVIYGSDALGGIIHFYTKTPKVSDKNEVNSSFYSRVGTVNSEFTAEGNVEIRNKKWASYTSISHSTFNDLKMGKNRNHGFENWGKVDEYSNNSENFYNSTPESNSNPRIQRNTGYDQIDLLQKIAIPISIKNDLILNFQYSKSSDIDRFDKLTEYSDNSLKFAEWYYGPQERLLVSSQLKLSPDLRWFKNGTITTAYQKIKESRIQRKFSSLDRSYRNEKVDVFSLNGDFFVPLTTQNNRILSYGFEVTHNEINSEAYGKTLSVNQNSIIGFSEDFRVQSRYPDGGSTYTSMASYINYRQDINKKSTLNTGIRYVNTRLTAKWIDETFISLPNSDIALNNSAVTTTLGYAYKPTPNWQLNTVISSGFRAPNIDDVGKIREKSGNVTIPNINLKPEYAYNFEVGLLKYFDDKKFQTEFNVYYTLLNNYIMRDFFGVNGSQTIVYDNEMVRIVTNMNGGNAYIVGSTFNFKGSLNETWFSKGSLTMTKGKSYDTKHPLSSIPPIFGILELGYNKTVFEISLNWKFNGKKRLGDYNLIEGIDNLEQTPYNSLTKGYYGNPEWHTFNMLANYKLKNNITLYLNIDNLLDVHYKEFASSISAPGRNVSVSLLVNI
jgi:hemoglobin/transferrin/lactoferrin receptor protein